MLVAFVLGTLTSSARPWSVIGGNASLQLTQDVPHPTKQGQAVESPLNTVTGTVQSADETDSLNIAVPSGDSQHAPVQTFAVLKVATKDSGTREVHIPVLDGPASNERWMRPEPEAIPEYVQRQLERHGYQLQQRRRFLQVQLEDGRQAVIPVDQYQVSLAGHGSS